jgi:hypothetical protein
MSGSQLFMNHSQTHLGPHTNPQPKLTSPIHSARQYIYHPPTPQPTPPRTRPYPNTHSPTDPATPLTSPTIGYLLTTMPQHPPQRHHMNTSTIHPTSIRNLTPKPTPHNSNPTYLANGSSRASRSALNAMNNCQTMLPNSPPNPFSLASLHSITTHYTTIRDDREMEMGSASLFAAETAFCSAP